MDTILQDLRFALRQLRRTPGFAIVAVVTLALGIGANTAIFSVMNAILLRALPGTNPYRLVFLHYRDQPENTSQTGYDDSSLSEPVFEQLRNDRRVFSDVMAFVPLSGPKLSVRYGEDLQQAYADMVSGNFFSGLGVRPVIGRTFSMDDENQHTQTAVLSYSYWSSRFSRDPNIIGKTLFIKAVPFTVIGVAAPEFIGLERRKATDLWVPFQNRPDLKPWGAPSQFDIGMYNKPQWFFLMIIGRLNPGITQQQALAQINPEYRAILEQTLGKTPKSDTNDKKVELYFTPARGIEGLNQQYKEPMYILMGMVALTLVIACANVAMLLIARNAARDREFSMRIALGGSRARIFIQLLTESLLLVFAGAVLGWLFAKWATTSLALWSDLQANLAPDRRVLLFTIGISALAGLIFGLAPLHSATRAPAAIGLKTSAASAQQDKGKIRSGKLVVGLQMSLCLVLLVGAGLLLRTLQNLGRANLGFQASGLVVFGISPPSTLKSDAEVIQFYTTLLDRLRTLPAVEAATLMENRMGAGWSNNTGIRMDGTDPNPGKFSPVRWNSVAPGFFHVIGATLRMGRDIADSDTAASRRVIVVNQTFVDRYLKGRNPLDHKVTLNGQGDKENEAYSIVGVVPDLKYTSVRERPAAMGWVPYTQNPGIAGMTIELRVRGNAVAVLDDSRRIVREFGPDIPLLQPTTQTEQFEQSYSDERLFSRLATFFGLLAALLVATGLYGTLAYRVSRRTSEIGVRMALGAQRAQVLWMVLRESLIIAFLGIAVGLPLAFAGALVLKSMLFGCGPADPTTFAIALVGIIAVALSAALWPARRASSVDPMVALRYE
jgi:predicted permease